MRKQPRLDKDEIKNAASGQWADVLVNVAGVSTDVLDGKHHPCPSGKCSSQTDAFRTFGDFEETGGMICNQCGKFADGIAAIQWLLGCDFRGALQRTADYLGITPSPNGNGQAIKLDLLEIVCRAKQMPIESAQAYGAHVAKRGKLDVVRFPVCNAKGEVHSHFDLSIDGGKGWFKKEKGNSGLFLPQGDDGKPQLPQADETWIQCEGGKDATAYHSLGFLACGLPTDHMNVKYARLFRGVHVIVMPDRKVVAETEAQKSAARIYGVAASVRIGTLPLELGGKQGDDARDVLRAKDGEEMLRTAVEDAVSWTPPNDDSVDLGVTKELADEICKVERFAQDEAGNIYRFNTGVYKHRGAEFIKRAVKRILEDWNRTKEWTPRLADAVCEYVRVDSPELWTQPTDDVVNVTNGLLQLSRRKLLPHSPDHLSSIQLPVKYDPDATCPATDKFDSQVFPKDAVVLSHEIAAWLICPRLKIQKALLLSGDGGNGKSRKLNQYKALIGSNNCSAISLHDLEANRFAAARLFGKLANICPDLPSAHLSGTSTFKAITGGDQITAEFKFKMSFEFECHARLVFSANHPPRSNDSSEAFFDRWLVVPFQGRFRGTSNEIPEADLDAMLTTPDELSGLLNHALECVDRLRTTARFTDTESVREAHREFYAATDPLAVWLDRFTIDDPDAKVSIAILRTAYGAECERQGRPKLTSTGFGRQIRRSRPDVEDRQRTINGRIQWCYVGIGMVQNDSADFTDLTGLTEFPPYKSHEASDEAEEKSEEKGNIKRENSVNPVNCVKDRQQQAGGGIAPADCNHLDPNAWQHRDGKAYCRGCDRFMGRVSP